MTGEDAHRAAVEGALLFVRQHEPAAYNERAIVEGIGAYLASLAEAGYHILRNDQTGGVSRWGRPPAWPPEGMNG